MEAGALYQMLNDIDVPPRLWVSFDYSQHLTWVNTFKNSRFMGVKFDGELTVMMKGKALYDLAVAGRADHLIVHKDFPVTVRTTIACIEDLHRCYPYRVKISNKQGWTGVVSQWEEDSDGSYSMTWHKNPEDFYKTKTYDGSTLFEVVDILPAGTVAVQQKADYPHTCPRCRKPAYIGFAKVDCSGGCS